MVERHCSPMETESHGSAINVLQRGFNNLKSKYAVKLSNVGNPDHRQDSTKPLPDTTCGWAHCETLKECVELVRLYISFYDLGGGNWNGGQIYAHSVFVGRVSYNGRVWDTEKFTDSSKEIAV